VKLVEMVENYRASDENFCMRSLLHACYSPLEQNNKCGEDFVEQEYSSNDAKQKPTLNHHIPILQSSFGSRRRCDYRHCIHQSLLVRVWKRSCPNMFSTREKTGPNFAEIESLVDRELCPYQSLVSEDLDHHFKLSTAPEHPTFSWSWQISFQTFCWSSSGRDWW